MTMPRQTDIYSQDGDSWSRNLDQWEIKYTKCGFKGHDNEECSMTLTDSQLSSQTHKTASSEIPC